MKLIVNAAPDSVSVYWQHPKGFAKGRGSVEANSLFGTIWWIARAVIVPTEQRGKGIGSAMLKALFKAVTKQGTCTRLIVCPGGYNGNKKKQFHFYEKNGFRHPVPADGVPEEYDPKYTLIKDVRPNEMPAAACLLPFGPTQD